MKRDLSILLANARRLDVPLVVGSSGGSGGNANLAFIADIVREVAAQQRLSFNLATIEAEPTREFLLERYRDGRFHALANAPEISEETLSDAHRIVAMMGPEPIADAIAAGADVVLAGRSSDAALFSAIPLQKGLPEGLVWHAAKIMECGGAAVAQMTKPEGMVCTITEDYFELEPVSPDQSCTTTSIASHALYETANPYRMREPGGTMVLDNVEYEQWTQRAVRVRGSEFETAHYTVRLEGASLVGYRAQVFGAITDPAILGNLDEWLETAKEGGWGSALRTYGAEIMDSCDVQYHVYGTGAVAPNQTGPSNGNASAQEVALLMIVTAPDEDTAAAVAYQMGHTILHYPVPQWSGLVSNLAFAHSPHVTRLGAAYNFVLNHSVELEAPDEIFSFDLEEVSV
ncbi:acyclic terpene utilization AtuA family protein [Glutamicibacter arilaitensis]|uniref:acyclic terpene utilization AtuA family protein n=1 Tax=Glutamicibacter arilaitensis TaxID=256701 RepID=UPI00384AC0A3